MDLNTDPALTELRRLASLKPPAWCKMAAAFERFAIRTFRVAAAAGIGGVALWLFGLAIYVLSQPFASLSPLGLLGGVLAGVAGLLLIAVALKVAFGAKGRSRIEAAWRENQSNNPQSQRRLLGYDN